jgi:hypothetical protein
VGLGLGCLDSVQERRDVFCSQSMRNTEHAARGTYKNGSPVSPLATVWVCQP